MLIGNPFGLDLVHNPVSCSTAGFKQAARGLCCERWQGGNEQARKSTLVDKEICKEMTYRINALLLNVLKNNHMCM